VSLGRARRLFSPVVVATLAAGCQWIAGLTDRSAGDAPSHADGGSAGNPSGGKAGEPPGGSPGGNPGGGEAGEPPGGSTGGNPNGGSGGNGGSAGAGTVGGADQSGGTLGATGGAGGSGGSGGTTGGSAGTSGDSGAGGSAGVGGGTAGMAAGGSGGVGAAGAGARGNGGAGTGGAGSGGNAGAGAGGAGGTGIGQSSGCGKAPGIASNLYNGGQHISITAAGLQREYVLNVPSNYDNTHPHKLVIAYHQLGGNDDELYTNQYYHLLPLAGDSTIFVAPNGQDNGANCSTASNCGWPNPNNTDLALADAVVAELEQNFCIDTNRIFATGWSYGASMSYKTACERPLSGGMNGYIRAVAVYSGAQLSGTCSPNQSVAFFASHGTQDSVLNYDGGVLLAQNFSTANGCSWMTPTRVSSGAHVCTDETGCKTGYPVRFCSFLGAHTADPDNGDSGGSWVYQEVWDFFSQF